MIGRLVAKVAGPRVLLGVIVAGGLAVGVLTWRWIDAARDAARAAQAADQAAVTARANAQAADALRAERDRLDTALTELRAQEQARRAKLETDINEVRHALDSEVCARAELPDAVRERVFPAADADGGGDASAAGDGSDESDRARG